MSGAGMKDPRGIIRRPLITEKGARLRESQNVYLFEVSPAANKIEIRKAVEEIFGVRVTNVRTINFAGKPKRMGRYAGFRSSWKKAIVTLAAGQTIELFEQV